MALNADRRQEITHATSIRPQQKITLLLGQMVQKRPRAHGVSVSTRTVLSLYLSGVRQSFNDVMEQKRRDMMTRAMLGKAVVLRRQSSAEDGLVQCCALCDRSRQYTSCRGSIPKAVAHSNVSGSSSIV